MFKYKSHNHNDYVLLYKGSEQWLSDLGRFLECQKCNILVATQALVLCLICPPSGIMRTYQATHSWLCYNYYLSPDNYDTTLIQQAILILKQKGLTSMIFPCYTDNFSMILDIKIISLSKILQIFDLQNINSCLCTSSMAVKINIIR